MLSIICALGKNHEIGKENKLLWHLPNDLQFFKATTSGHPIIMGRKTFESIGKALPNRTNMVISRQQDWMQEGILIINSLKEALKHAKKISEEVFVIGGQDIYEQCLPLADKMYLTYVDTPQIDADRFFPQWKKTEWVLISERHFEIDEQHAYSFTIQVWERKIKLEQEIKKNS